MSFLTELEGVQRHLVKSIDYIYPEDKEQEPIANIVIDGRLISIKELAQLVDDIDNTKMGIYNLSVVWEKRPK